MSTITSTQVTVAPLRADFLERARTLGVDDLGQPVKRLRAEGGEPCRDVLRRALPGEELILASYSPFAKPGPYHEYGPVYILANPSDEPVSRDAFPRAGGQNYLRDAFVIRAYNENEEIVDAEMSSPAKAEQTIERLLARDDAAFLHVRFPVYGCFAFRIDRA